MDNPLRLMKLVIDQGLSHRYGISSRAQEISALDSRGQHVFQWEQTTQDITGTGKRPALVPSAQLDSTDIDSTDIGSTDIGVERHQMDGADHYQQAHNGPGPFRLKNSHWSTGGFKEVDT